MLGISCCNTQIFTLPLPPGCLLVAQLHTLQTSKLIPPIPLSPLTTAPPTPIMDWQRPCIKILPTSQRSSSHTCRSQPSPPSLFSIPSPWQSTSCQLYLLLLCGLSGQDMCSRSASVFTSAHPRSSGNCLLCLKF